MKRPKAWTAAEFRGALEKMRRRTVIQCFVPSLFASVYVYPYPCDGFDAFAPRYRDAKGRWCAVTDDAIAPHEALWIACMVAGLADIVETALPGEREARERAAREPCPVIPLEKRRGR